MAATTLRLETPRLLLRPLEMCDFEAFAAFHAEPESMRFLGGVQPREVAWRTLMLMAGAWHLQGISMFSMIEKATGRWVGRTRHGCHGHRSSVRRSAIAPASSPVSSRR